MLTIKSYVDETHSSLATVFMAMSVIAARASNAPVALAVEAQQILTASHVD